jgi:hypothetical protein
VLGFSRFCIIFVAYALLSHRCMWVLHWANICFVRRLA